MMVRRFVHVLFALPVLSAPFGASVWANEIDHLVAKHAAAHGLPPDLVRRVIHIESKGNPRVVNAGNYGLMQIRLGTARAMGYTGDADGLLDADTNMTYAVRYLAGAYRAAGGNPEQAIRNYQRGYYDQAKAQGFSPYAYNASGAPPPQLAAPDPLLVRQQQEAERRKAAELQRLAALESRIEQQKIAEQVRIAKRRAEHEARMARELAAEEARIARRDAAGQAKPEAPAQPSAAAAPGPGPNPAAAAPRRQPAPPGYAWYNPMRYFKHPLHEAHPYRRER
jgi:hypothetical protein